VAVGAIEQGKGLPVKAVFSGFITDEKTGEPVTDAALRIRGKGKYYEAKTNQEGFYSFDEIEQTGDYQVEIISKNYVGLDFYTRYFIQLNKDEQTSKNIELKKACKIKVRVIDEDGKPIKGARVRAVTLGTVRSKEVVGTLNRESTDEDGLILLGGFEPADAKYLISAAHLGERQSVEHYGERRYIRKSDYAPGKLEVTLSDPNRIGYGEIVLRKGAKVQGYAQYSDGIPASGLIVTAGPDGYYSGETDSYIIEPNGFFTLENIIPCTYRIYINTPRIQGMWGDTIKTVYAELPLEEDETLFVDLPKKSPQSLAAIRGTLTFVGDGIPEGVVVFARVYLPGQRAQKHYERFTKKRGELENSFVIDDLEPGTYKLKFTAKSFEDVIIEDVKAPSEGLEVELVFAGKPKLKGNVLSSLTGKPVSKFKARAKILRSLRGQNYGPTDKWLYFDNVKGEYEINTYTPGIYQVQIAAKGFVWTWSREINTDEDEDVSIELTAGGSIQGRIINEQGGPVSGAVVIPLSKAKSIYGDYKMFMSQEGAVETIDGKFILENLPEGLETIQIIHPDYCITTVNDIEVVEGRSTKLVEAVLTKGGIVEGYCYDVHGVAEPNVILYVQDDAYYGGSEPDRAGRLTAVITDSNGFYRAEKLPPRRCQVKRLHERSALGVVRQVILPVEGKVSQLHFGFGRVLRGKIIVTGRPLAYERISIRSVKRGERFPSLSFHGRSLTAEDGSFTLVGVPPGQYTVYLQDPQRNMASFHAAKVEMGQQDTDVGVISCERYRTKK
jgi:protocatechuate 3,4-dioxygenase beta subunit